MSSIPLGWGRDPYGTSSYGGTGLGVGVSIEAAVALSTHDVQVTLNTPPQAIAPTIPGDALNPSTWVVQRLDNGAFLNVVNVTIFEPTVFILTTIQDFGPANVTHTVSSSTLLDPSGQVIVPPNSANFLGCLAASQVSALAAAAAQQVVPADIANPPTAQVNTLGALGGTLQMSSGGDYVLESGSPLLKKLILRRLITRQGEFFHLPGYGAGIQEKGLAAGGDLSTLKATIESQVKQEREVQDCTAKLSLSNNILTILLAVQVKGQQSPLSMTVTQPVAAF